MSHNVVHFEINGPDKAALQRFYGDAFDWTVNADNPMGYGLVEHDQASAGIGGGIDEGSGVIIYIEVDDPAAALERVKELGGTVVEDVSSNPMVTLAKFADPAGNVIGLVKTEG
jgi:predicted enzyme related to lactoylglutathione lyase